MKQAFGLPETREKVYIASGIVAKIEAGIELDSLDYEILAGDPLLLHRVEKIAYERAGDREECVLDWGELYDVDDFPYLPWEKEEGRSF